MDQYQPNSVTTGSSTSQYLWGPGGLVRWDGEGPTADGLGNTRLVTSGSQSITSTQVPDAYGQSIVSSGSTALPYQWRGSSGYRSDLDAGLTLVGARYYDKDSGRFISRDTVLSEASYAYCNSDPINFSDPSGHKKKWDPWGWLKNWLGNGGAGYVSPTRFTHSDWQSVAEQTQKNGTKEQILGATLIGFNLKNNPQYTPGNGNPFVVRYGPVAAVAGGLAAGGTVARGIGMMEENF